MSCTTTRLGGDKLLSIVKCKNITKMLLVMHCFTSILYYFNAWGAGDGQVGGGSVEKE